MKERAAVIGCGRLGGSLAVRLSEIGYEVKFVSSASGTRASEFSKMIGSSLLKLPSAELAELDIVFIAVPDSEIVNVVDSLIESLTLWKGKKVYHCSGALTSEVLQPLREAGASTLAFHPLQTFPAGIQTERFIDIYFAIEGDDIKGGHILASRLGGQAIVIKSEGKALYHAAACTISNYLFGLADAAVKMLQAGDVNRDDALKILLPLIKGTIRSMEEEGIPQGLTGPIARGDASTIKAHLESLGNHPELLSLYKSMGKYILSLTELSKETIMDGLFREQSST